MAPSITFSHPAGSPTISPAGSGNMDTVAFMGPGGFGFSISVGEYNDNTYISNDDGTTEYPGGAASGALPNLKYQDSTHAYVANESSGTLLQDVNPSEATFMITVDGFDSAVTIQNGTLRVYDRTTLSNAPSGLTVQAFEIIAGASGDTSWTSIGGNTTLPFDDHTVAASSHQFYVGMSVSPQSLGAKLMSLRFSVEAL